MWNNLARRLAPVILAQWKELHNLNFVLNGIDKKFSALYCSRCWMAVDNIPMLPKIIWRKIGKTKWLNQKMCFAVFLFMFWISVIFRPNKIHINKPYDVINLSLAYLISVFKVKQPTTPWFLQIYLSYVSIYT